MKKVLLSVLGAAAIFAVGCQASKEQTAEKFKKQCVAELSKQAPEVDEATKKSMDEYCGCMATKVSEKFTPKEVDELLASMSDSAKAKDVSDKIMPVVQPCMEEMMTKMMGSQMGAAADSLHQHAGAALDSAVQAPAADTAKK